MRPPIAALLLALAGLTACSPDDRDAIDFDDTQRPDPYIDDSDYKLIPVETGVPFPWDTSLIDTGDSDPFRDPPDTDADQCPPDYIEDCRGQCFSSTLVGDGFCDDGPAPSPDFDCEAFDRDDGDCPVDTGPPPDTDPPDTDTDLPEPLPPCEGPFEVRDCNDACYPSTWIGDGNCDEGDPFPYGSPDFNCAEFEFDGGDCPRG